MKKNIILLIFLFSLNFIQAEEGEFQFGLGVGAYFPLNQYTDDKTVYIYTSYNIPVTLYFGITDNFDLGLYGSFTRITDSYTTGEYNGLSGREYFNYHHFNIGGRLRYNFFPGYPFFAPHVFVGMGNNIETFTNREFYIDGNKLYKDFDKGSYTDGTLNFQFGLDFTSRIWWVFFLNLELVYNQQINRTGFFELNFYVGIDGFLKTYGGR